MDNVDLEIEEQHPIPQQISSYQFRLVGDMTLKQFFQVAGGAIVSIVLYSSSLPAIVKWPLIIFSFLMGIALAFFPLANRPLSVWLFAFFKTIYSPTIYRWQEISPKISFYQDDTSLQQQTGTVVNPNAATEVINKNAPTVVVNPNLENTEKEFLNKVQDMFKSPMSVSPSKPAENIGPAIGHKVPVPQLEKVKVETTAKSQEPPQSTESVQTSVGSGISPIPAKTISQAQKADFIPEVSPPAPPTIANVVVGQVLDRAGKIISGAILEIRDESGRPVRALRSNKLGHFMIVTPLSNGKYEIITERENFSFSAIYFFANGEIIPPIRITGKPLQVSGNQDNLNIDSQTN